MRVQGNDFFASLTFPVGDSFCTWVTGGWGGDIVGLSSIDGWDASDNETRSYFNFENGRWYALRLQVTDDRIMAWIDEQPIVDVDITGRAIGLRHGEIKLSAPLRVRFLRDYGRVCESRVSRAARPTRSGSSPTGRRASDSRSLPCELVTRPVAGSYSSFLPARCATRPSSICSIIVPE